MTKSGKPSLISDLRLYGLSTTDVLEGCEEAAAFGQRVVELLRQRQVSLGAWTHLYLTFDSQNTTHDHTLLEGTEWWFRRICVSVPEDFNSQGSEVRNRIVIDRITDILLTLVDDHALVHKVCSLSKKHHQNLYFLVKRKSIRGINVAAWMNIPAHPKRSQLIVTVNNEQFSMSNPIRLSASSDAWPLVSNIKLEGDTIILVPRQSFSAQIRTKRYDPPVKLSLDNFVARKDVVMEDNWLVLPS